MQIERALKYVLNRFKGFPYDGFTTKNVAKMEHTFRISIETYIQAYFWPFLRFLCSEEDILFIVHKNPFLYTIIANRHNGGAGRRVAR